MKMGKVSRWELQKGMGALSKEVAILRSRHLVPHGKVRPTWPDLSRKTRTPSYPHMAFKDINLTQVDNTEIDRFP